MLIISYLLAVVVGAACGWLEYDRLKRVQDLRILVALGIAGAVGGHWFFTVWGWLVPGNLVLSAFVAGMVGASVVLSGTGMARQLLQRLG